jgi:transcriptional regulator with XRE-family HTH domain
MIKNFAENVARLRKKFGFSQDELARKIDVNRQTISKIERGTGNPTLETIEKISEVFNATPIQLFGTPKEIAVSDTPVILNRIDEYNDKIQKILKVGTILENEESIERLLDKLMQLEYFFVEQPRTDSIGDVTLDKNNQVIYDRSTFDFILDQEETLDRIIEKFNTIQYHNLSEDNN